MTCSAGSTRPGSRPAASTPASYCEATDVAVRAFQAAHGLPPDGVCDEPTWSALVEASWSLGDRLLAYRTPMHQRATTSPSCRRALGRLGFDAGRVDGIFGPLTAVALADFQRNSGLHPDGICGFETLQALRRVANRTGDTPVAAVREHEALLHASPRLTDKRVVVGELGGLGALCRAVTKALRLAGAKVMPLDEPDGSLQARAANGFGADLYLGLSLAEGPTSVAYYAVTGFESRRWPALGRAAPRYGCSRCSRWPRPHAHGMRLPVLRGDPDARRRLLPRAGG